MKGRPYSDAEIRPETPEVIRYLRRQQIPVDSAEWHRDAGIKQRGLGIRDVDTDADVFHIDTLPTPGKEKI